MADMFDDKKRSEIMSRVRSKNNKSTELKLIQIFKENGITGWRRNYKVKGHPDFVFLDKKIAIFVDGCFWHGHNCKKGKLPSSNIDFWKEKISNNKSRDDKNSDLLAKLGWKVIIIWQCEISNINSRKIRLEFLLEELRSQGF